VKGGDNVKEIMVKLLNDKKSRNEENISEALLDSEMVFTPWL